MQLNITKKMFPGNCETIISNARMSTLISPIGELLKYLETAREIKNYYLFVVIQNDSLRPLMLVSDIYIFFKLIVVYMWEKNL